MQFVNFSEAFALLPQHGSQSVTDHAIPHRPHTFPSRNVSIRNSAKLFSQKWKSFFSMTCKIVQ